MTVIGQMFEEEKQEAIKKNTEEVTERTSSKIAENFLRAGESPEKVAKCTGLSLEKVQEIEASLLQTV